jgi:hypothetical protein
MNHRYRPLALGVAVLLALGIVRGAALRGDHRPLRVPARGRRPRAGRALASDRTERAQPHHDLRAHGAPDADTAVRASRAFESALRQETIGGLRDRPRSRAAPPRAWSAASSSCTSPAASASWRRTRQPQARARISRGRAHARGRGAAHALASPMAPMLSRVAPRDPFQIVPGPLRGLRGSAANDLTVRDGRFIASDQRTAVLFLSTRSSAFDADVQAPVIAGIRARIRAGGPSFGGTLELDQSGLNRFATRAATAIKGDIQRVSTLSMLLIGALLFGLFRSLRLLALASIPVGAGVLAGSFVVLLLFGRVHGITMAFGASLIGLSVDYVVHVYCFHALHAGTREGNASFATIGQVARHGRRHHHHGLLGAGSLVALGAPRGRVLLRERHVRRVPRHALHAARAHAGHVSPGGAALACLDAGPRLRRAPHAAALAVGLPCGHRRLRGVVLPRARWNEDFASLGASIRASSPKTRASAARWPTSSKCASWSRWATPRSGRCRRASACMRRCSRVRPPASSTATAPSRCSCRAPPRSARCAT